MVAPANPVAVCHNCKAVVEFIPQPDGTLMMSRWCCDKPAFTFICDNPRKLGVITGITDEPAT